MRLVRTFVVSGASQIFFKPSSSIKAASLLLKGSQAFRKRDASSVISVQGHYVESKYK